MALRELNTESFKDLVLDSELPVLVDFWAAWCGPCRMLAPIVEEIAEENNGKAEFAKVNVDEEMELSTAYSVQTIPTLILFRNGQEAGRLVGLRSKEDILKFVGV